MRIVIFSGGTGSVALQRGLYQFIEKSTDGIDIKIVVNAYDNGLSTGAVRRVMGGHILGPSDVRKNQTTRLRIIDPNNCWLKFLDLRFTAAPSDAYDFCKSRTDALISSLGTQAGGTDPPGTLLGAVDEYFRQPAAVQIEYDDFSLANVIYAGLSRANGNSLRAAGRIMADAMQIKDNVLLNDDRSLFLGATTRSGQRVTDEGDIVAWGNESDPFTSIFFVDAEGAPSSPELCLEAWQAIVDADLIILSSGTQWSSLIPTYASRGFGSAIRDSRAEIVMVMNRAPDKDCPSQTASDIVDILVPRYFDAGRLNVLCDKRSHPNMRELNQSALLKVSSFSQIDLSDPGGPPDKHDPTKLAEAIGYVYFRSDVGSEYFLFDYDDTLCGRESSYPLSSRFNVQGIDQLNALAKVGVCSGNCVEALRLKAEPNVSAGRNDSSRKPLRVFADGGINEYRYFMQPSEGEPPYRMVGCVTPDALLPATGPLCADNIVEALIRAGIPASQISNRGNAVIAIRPIARERRQAVISLASHIVYGSDMEVLECGRSTVEIRKRGVSKIGALKQLYAEAATPTITYVGDECESGNDHEIYRLASERAGLKCLSVSGPPMTAFFLATLLAHLRNNASR